MDLFWVSFGLIGLPFVLLTIYFDLRYGVHDVLTELVHPITWLINYFRFRTVKRYKQNFHLSGCDEGGYSIISFVRELYNGLNPRPDEHGFNGYTDVMEFYCYFEAAGECCGPDYLNRCKQVFENDKKVFRLISNLRDTLNDEQYGKNTPYCNFVKDLNLVLVELLTELNKRKDKIYRKLHR